LRVIERRTAEQAAAVAERAVDSAQENEKVTRERYREGVASSSDLLDAKVKSLRAALDRTDALARLLLARANLDRAVGRLR
jgi:outer membrane protein TolC